ncbi:MAG: hypothetical protein ACR2JP_00265 [Acidimicrobiia bacterium]
MNQPLVTVLAVLAAWNPPAAAGVMGTPSRPRLVGLGIAAGVGILLAVLGERVIDLLGVSAPTFRTASGVVVAATGSAHLLRRPPRPVEGDGITGGVIAGLGPGPVFAATAGGADAGWWIAALCVGAAAAATWWWAARNGGSSTVTAWLIRSIGAVAVLAGVVMTIDGASTV